MSIPPPPGNQPPQDPYGPAPATWHRPPGPNGRPYGAPVSVNALAVAALVLGVLCFLPGLGAVLGLVALAQIRRSGQSGRGLAVAGVALSSAGIVLWAVTLSTGVAGTVWEGLKDGTRPESLSLRKGDCFDAPGGLEGATFDVDRVACQDRHDGEVFAVVALPGGAFPGDDEIGDIADERCRALQSQYAMDSWAMPADVDAYYLMPSRDTWRFGDRAITCVFGNTEAKAKLTGSLRGDATTLDGDQVVFLTAANALDAALYEEPEDGPEDDFGGHRAWADRMHDVLGEQIETLRGHSWPSSAREPVEGLVADLEDARREWRKASTAPDTETYYTHYDQAYGSVDGASTVTARKALGLAASPPAYDERVDEETEAQV
ncbi:DUF4190 domain-containing protein [Streptomyces sp. NPDC058735]|uniref:DUF4190 domain-containing protein n=1 Tax=unclassified Streptomyces TaxID=2593676 RepID=UPI0036C6BE2B